ncbi:hypothetical protein HN014_22115 (plasmid) [Aquimarina sp. TRL1]|uniref:hypothetical protein n=1 Tax=Aquimarina sp. (strain TRL1) TaxID=2736252 RepID=UPI0015889ECB|nr:hypothetical protein [Aquimarina sp. TRL1]QKX07784.1 hypothetical protein HN014_22115 [Aquimarina sp. TRL1]
MGKNKELELIDKAGNEMLSQFEIYSLKQDLAIELKKECLSLMKKVILQKKADIFLYYYTKPVMDEINNLISPLVSDNELR